LGHLKYENRKSRTVADQASWARMIQMYMSLSGCYPARNQALSSYGRMECSLLEKGHHWEERPVGQRNP